MWKHLKRSLKFLREVVLVETAGHGRREGSGRGTWWEPRDKGGR
jgi:hypothetical protein